MQLKVALTALVSTACPRLTQDPCSSVDTVKAEREAQLSSRIQQLQNMTVAECRYAIHKEVSDFLEEHRDYMQDLLGPEAGPKADELTERESKLLGLTQDIVCGLEPCKPTQKDKSKKPPQSKVEGKGENRPPRNLAYGYDDTYLPVKPRPVRPGWLRVPPVRDVEVDQPVQQLAEALRNAHTNGNGPWVRTVSTTGAVARQAPTFLASFLHGMLAFII